jgi:pro-apoptotic serine protease NMA111
VRQILFMMLLAAPLAAAAVPVRGGETVPLATAEVAAEVAAEPSDWRATLERIAPSVVTIRVDGPRAFDTNWNMSTQATGFVVDAERGLILTNRHVVTAGPVVAEAVFLNHEEVELTPVYRDPVHDFGFFRYDPAKLRHITPETLPLAPEGVVAGREIRIVGNDAGEQISILAGTLARLDREAPFYGRGQYNDFNTFYIQAASGTSGGSSGSPVLDIQGRVVALNAGANTQAASSFFLPLERVRRALDLIIAGQPVTRGTLLTTFVHMPYDELGRLGLDAAAEARYRALFPRQKGLLVVRDVVAGAPAEGILEPGDILLTANGEPLATFHALAEVLDENVGATLRLAVRRGAADQELEVEITDLHAVTPSDFLQIGDAVLHDLSYQQARHLNTRLEGVYVANPGYMFMASAVPRGAVIVEIDGQPTPDLQALRGIIEAVPDRARVAVRFYDFENPRNTQLRSVRVDRRWFPAAHCRRDDALGDWPCEPLADVGVAALPEPSTTRFPAESDRRLRALQASLVMVNFEMPYSVSGIADRFYHGTGLVVDAERGLVVVDRNTVPDALGDVTLTFAGSLETPARVEFIHPLHNLAVLRYEPRLIGDTPVRPARLSMQRLRPGDEVSVVGLRGDHRLASQATRVSSIDALNLPLSRTLRFRDANLETIQLVSGPADFDGVLSDGRGQVVGMWSSFAIDTGRMPEQTNMGVSAALVAEVLALARDERPLHSLEAEFVQLPLASARRLGLPAELAATLEAHDPERRQILQVVRTVAATPAAEMLRPGDLLLAIEGRTVNRFREVEEAVQVPVARTRIWRQGRVVDLEIPTVSLGSGGVERVVLWAGALLQPPHRAVAAQRGIEPSGVFVAFHAFGSPASRNGLSAGRRIVEVDGRPTPDFDSFLAAISGRQDREPVRLRAVNWNGQVEVFTLKLDNRYWPPYELALGEDGHWHRREL